MGDRGSGRARRYSAFLQHDEPHDSRAAEYSRRGVRRLRRVAPPATKISRATFAPQRTRRLKAKGENAKNIGCESCHGPGSLHVKSGGAAHTIINPRKSPETCFQCHLEVRAQFQLPHHHPVLEGKMSCADCHNPHVGMAIKGGGTNVQQIAQRRRLCFLEPKRNLLRMPHRATRPVCLRARGSAPRLCRSAIRRTARLTKGC